VKSEFRFGILDFELRAEISTWGAGLTLLERGFSPLILALLLVRVVGGDVRALHIQTRAGAPLRLAAAAKISV
jgi:hypothetical protein